VRWFPFVLVAIVAVLVQATLMRLARFGDAFPDLLVALLATFSLGIAPAEAFVAGAILGLGRDLFSCGPFGLCAAAFAVVGWAASGQRPATVAGHFLTRAAFAFVCSAATSLALAVPEVLSGNGPAPALLARGTALTAVSAAALAAAVGGMVWHKARWFGLRARSEFANV
jgi:rod shape-determining protein MreD